MLTKVKFQSDLEFGIVTADRRRVIIIFSKENYVVFFIVS